MIDTKGMLERIERTLAECDARSLPPLTSETAAAVMDLAELAGLRLDLWQRSVLRSMYADKPPPLIAITTPGPPSVILDVRRQPACGFSADWVIDDELAPEPSRPWWRRWWSR